MDHHEFWQDFYAADTVPTGPWAAAYPAKLPTGAVLMLPIRPLAGTRNAIASLILNQASLAVESALADILAEKLGAYAPDVIVGLPTLGLSLARAVAERLGHTRYVPLGTSRKFWYDDALSVPLSSITTPDSKRRLYLDPRLVPVLEGRRIALIDDAISTGSSIIAGLGVLELIGTTPIAIGAAMLQTNRWHKALSGFAVEGVFQSPLLENQDGLWREAQDQTALKPL
jgi:adenine/guanine phosphoribosyltransferase-like PRPP-binding protein